MPLLAFVQKHLASKGTDISKLKLGVYAPKTGSGITVKRSDKPVAKATAAPLGVFSKKRERGSKPKTASFMKKK